jgi:hypothetical protein
MAIRAALKPRRFRHWPGAGGQAQRARASYRRIINVMYALPALRLSKESEYNKSAARHEELLRKPAHDVHCQFFETFEAFCSRSLRAFRFPA